MEEIIKKKLTNLNYAFTMGLIFYIMFTIIEHLKNLPNSLIDIKLYLSISIFIGVYAFMGVFEK